MKIQLLLDCGLDGPICIVLSFIYKSRTIRYLNVVCRDFYELLNDKNFTYDDLCSVVRLAILLDMRRCAEMCTEEVNRYSNLMASISDSKYTNEIIGHIKTFVAHNQRPLPPPPPPPPTKRCRNEAQIKKLKIYTTISAAVAVAAIGYCIFKNKK